MDVGRATPRSLDRSNSTNEHLNPSEVPKRNAITRITDYIARGVFQGLSLLFRLFGYKNLQDFDDDLPVYVQRQNLHRLSVKCDNLEKKIKSVIDHSKKKEKSLKDRLKANKTELDQIHNSCSALNSSNTELQKNYQSKSEELDEKNKEIKLLKQQLFKIKEKQYIQKTIKKYGGDRTPSNYSISSEQSESLAEKMSRYTNSQHEGSPRSDHQNDPESFTGLGLGENGDTTGLNALTMNRTSESKSVDGGAKDL